MHHTIRCTDTTDITQTLINPDTPVEMQSIRISTRHTQYINLINIYIQPDTSPRVPRKKLHTQHPPTWQHHKYNNSRKLQCQRHNFVWPQPEQHQSNTHRHTIQHVHPKQHRTIQSHPTPGTLPQILNRHNLLFSNIRLEQKHHMANSTHTSL